MNNKILLITMLALMLVALPMVSAEFTTSHIYDTLSAWDQVDSVITQKCAPYLDVVLDGQTADDIPVLHYFDEKVMSYISTHTRGSGYEACLEEAGSDVELQCHCLGRGIHIVQDSFFHTKDGVVPKYLSKYASTNLIGHMTVERNFETKLIQKLKDTSDHLYTSGKLDYYNSIVCNSFLVQEGGDAKYIELMNTASGIDMRNDINIFCNGYKGTGFYDTVYNQKLVLPFWFWAVSIGLTMLGAALVLLSLMFGKTNWKWLLILEGIILLAIGLTILIAFFTNNTWSVVQYAVEIPAKFGILSVSDKDVTDYTAKAIDATKAFLQNGVLKYDDSSGLTYVDKQGNVVLGALGQSETTGIWALRLFIAVFILLNVWLVYKAFRRSK